MHLASVLIRSFLVQTQAKLFVNRLSISLLLSFFTHPTTHSFTHLAPLSPLLICNCDSVLSFSSSSIHHLYSSLFPFHITFPVFHSLTHSSVPRSFFIPSCDSVLSSPSFIIRILPFVLHIICPASLRTSVFTFCLYVFNLKKKKKKDNPRHTPYCLPRHSHHIFTLHDYHSHQLFMTQFILQHNNEAQHSRIYLRS